MFRKVINCRTCKISRQRHTKSTYERYVSTTESKTQQPNGFFARISGSAGQIALNSLGLFLVMSMAFHDAKISASWDKREQEVNEIQRKLVGITTLLTDKEYLKSVEEKIKQGGSLEEELEIKLKIIASDNVLEKLDAVEKLGNNSDVAAIDFNSDASSQMLLTELEKSSGSGKII